MRIQRTEIRRAFEKSNLNLKWKIEWRKIVKARVVEIMMFKV